MKKPRPHPRLPSLAMATERLRDVLTAGKTRWRPALPQHSHSAPPPPAAGRCPHPRWRGPQNGRWVPPSSNMVSPRPSLHSVVMMAAAASASRGLRSLLLRRLAASHMPHLSYRPVSSSEELSASQAKEHNYESLKVTEAGDHILHVQLNRPEKRNAMNRAFWREMVECFSKIAQDPHCRVVVLSGAGKMFTSGLDLMDMGGELFQPQGEDTARISWNLRHLITRYQESFTVLEKCPKPVIAAIHGGCIGGGMDLISACDIRYCAQDAWFQVKEVDIGLAADVGTLQRLPRIIGSQSLVNELAFTARKMMASEALSSGLVSRVFQDHASLLAAAFALATEISSKSPVAIQGTKVNLLYSRDHSVAEGLNFMTSWNMSMLQTKDVSKSIQAALEKKDLKSVAFSKL